MDYKSEYAKKLRDPRWQKKRLEIMQRDDFACQICFDTEATLSVHHRRYVSGREPWEYSNNALVTLCESCHKQESECIKESIEYMNEVVRDYYFSYDMDHIATALRTLAVSSNCPPSVIIQILSKTLSSKGFVRNMEKKYFKNIKITKAIEKAE